MFHVPHREKDIFRHERQHFFHRFLATKYILFLYCVLGKVVLHNYQGFPVWRLTILLKTGWNVNIFHPNIVLCHGDITALNWPVIRDLYWLIWDWLLPDKRMNRIIQNNFLDSLFTSLQDNSIKLFKMYVCILFIHIKISKYTYIYIYIQ